MNQSTHERIRIRAKGFFEGSAGSHGWDHTERVIRLARHIGKAEGADLEVVELAATLHDIGRKQEDESLGEVCHAEVGATLARSLLQEQGIHERLIDRILHCILHHRYRKGITPDSLEAKVVFDADKLDAIGAVGIGRAFLFAGEQGAKLYNTPGIDPLREPAYSQEDTAYREFLHKLQHVHKRLLTAEGKRLAERRHAFMLAFFDELQAEIAGKH